MLISLAVLVTVGVVIIWVNLARIERWGVGIHQKSVTRSLAAWGVESARITNDASAVHVVEMLGYIRSYYVPGPGYRGPLDAEVALERQRRESLERIVASLERYSSLDYGTNVEQWVEWAEKRKSNEPSDAANRSQPNRAQTNRSSVKVF